MTAIDAAILELEAHREHVCLVIATLRRFARVVEDAHLPGEELVGAVAKPVAPLTTPPQATPHVATAKAYPNDAKVRQALTGEWQTVESVAHRAKLPKGTAYQRLSRMHGTGEVATRSEGKRTLYRLARVPAQPRPRAVAGTQAAPPVGPPSANGRHASTGDFEVAWNGTKERNGEAPSILPPRERRA